MEIGPIIQLFDTLIGLGTALGLAVSGFFVMLGGYQYMTAGGSARSIESAKSSIANALIGLAIVVLCRVIARLVGTALGAPNASGGLADLTVAAVAAYFPQGG